MNKEHENLDFALRWALEPRNTNLARDNKHALAALIAKEVIRLRRHIRENNSTARERFAAAALTAIVSKSPWGRAENEEDFVSAKVAYSAAALGAYAYADAMLEARAE